MSDERKSRNVIIYLSDDKVESKKLKEKLEKLLPILHNDFLKLNKMFLKKEYYDEKRKMVFFTKEKEKSTGGILFSEDIKENLECFNGFVEYKKDFVNYKSMTMFYQLKKINDSYEIQINNSKNNLLLYNTEINKIYFETFNEDMIYKIKINQNVTNDIIEIMNNSIDGFIDRNKYLKEKNKEILDYHKELENKLQIHKKTINNDYGISLN